MSTVLMANVIENKLLDRKWPRLNVQISLYVHKTESEEKETRSARIGNVQHSDKIILMCV